MKVEEKKKKNSSVNVYKVGASDKAGTRGRRTDHKRRSILTVTNKYLKGRR